MLGPFRQVLSLLPGALLCVFAALHASETSAHAGTFTASSAEISVSASYASASFASASENGSEPDQCDVRDDSANGSDCGGEGNTGPVGGSIEHDEDDDDFEDVAPQRLGSVELQRFAAPSAARNGDRCRMRMRLEDGRREKPPRA